ncbi:hypothetical protein MMYC01_207486 [Madurella mycetomatis]|uniref:Uncharacterized protein n=1 Tax=Madurella mycetomatis TaxID=100816 RepID=A0A175VWR9_9PEZI|nr:hypothetical protein MMYC01_207486 [Madurella mycetomatis]
MEEQTREYPQTQPPSESAPSDAHLPPSRKQLSASLPILRFPKPQGSQHLANWVSNSFPGIMEPSPVTSDSGSLADSAYEIINGTDSESQDGRLTESTGSLSVPQPDDVHSLDGSETRYDSDSDEESDHSSHASSIRYADQALRNPSTQLPTSSLEYGFNTEGSGVVVRSIEFEEGGGDEPVLLEKISVKHAIREFSDEESAAVARNLDLPDAPKRLVATIRQTMSQTYLSTREPLRLLYVGRPDAQRSIVLKICSAIWASPKIGTKDQDYFSRHREGVYNIVPISSFGPAPELDLMQASHYQIKVEHCTSAEEVIYEGSSFPGDTVYSITIEYDRAYTSLFSPSGSVVQPRWDLPHIAIFYCAEKEDTEAERTRNAAWAFMSRHGVPSIFITEQQDFGKKPTGRWADCIDEHTVHLCLESRDPERPMAAQRFPIDYASFAEIDARQMNRNLAYLTGLSEPGEPVAEMEAPPTKETQGLGLLEIFSRVKQAWVTFVEPHVPKRWLVLAFALPILMSLAISFFTTAVPESSRPGGVPQTLSQPHSICASPLSPSTAGLTTTSQIPPVATSTTTVVINVTSTKTVQVSQAKPSTSTLASALPFAGLLSDRPSAAAVNSEFKRPVCPPKKTTCSVHIYSPTELLVAIPSRNKAVWLAHGAINIDVYRGDELLKTKISSTDEGVLVEFPLRDAYGVLNVSVVTTRRPKINETFEVDFGKTAVTEVFEAGLHMLEDAIKRVSASVDEASHLIEDKYVPAFEQALEAVRSHTVDKVNRATNSARTHIVRHLESAEKLRKGLDLSILKAQITSRLWWLRMQGKMDEYAEYQRRASQFLKTRHDELVRGQKPQEKKGSRFLFGMRHGSGWSCKWGCGKTSEGTKDGNRQDSGRDNRWKKLILGGE